MKPSRQEREDRREERAAKRNNADIRPWIQVAEAADLALSILIKSRSPP